MTGDATEGTTPIPSWAVVLVSGMLLTGGAGILTWQNARVGELQAEQRAQAGRLGALESSDAARKVQLDQINETLHDLRGDVREIKSLITAAQPQKSRP